MNQSAIERYTCTQMQFPLGLKHFASSEHTLLETLEESKRTHTHTNTHFTKENEKHSSCIYLISMASCKHVFLSFDRFKEHKKMKLAVSSGFSLRI